MKWLLVFVIAVVGLISVISDHVDDKNKEACESELKKVAAYNNASDGQKFRCVYSCMSQKAGITDKNGHYSIEKLESYMHLKENSITDEQKCAIKKCEEQHADPSNACNQSWFTAICVNDVLYPPKSQDSN